MLLKNTILMIVAGFLFFSFTSLLHSQQMNPVALEKQITREQLVQNQPLSQQEQLDLTLQNFIVEAGKVTSNHKSLLSAIDQIGQTYLRKQHDSDEMVRIFNQVLNNSNLSEAEMDELAEWIAASYEWKIYGNPPNTPENSDALFRQGKEQFLQGMEKLDYPADKAGNRHISQAQLYLIPFIVHHPLDPRMGEVLYMMGKFRQRFWGLPTYGVDNFYFKEVIRQFSHTLLAMKAFQTLNDNVHMKYSGSGGDFTPESVLMMLKTYEALAKVSP